MTLIKDKKEIEALFEKIQFAPFLDILQNEEIRKNISSKLSKSGFAIVEMEGDEVNGFISGYGNSNHIIFINFLYLKEGRGVKSVKTFRNILREAQGENPEVEAVRIEVSKQNIHAKTMYEKMGFVTIEEKEESLIMEVINQGDIIETLFSKNRKQ